MVVKNCDIFNFLNTLRLRDHRLLRVTESAGENICCSNEVGVSTVVIVKD